MPVCIMISQDVHTKMQFYWVYSDVRIVAEALSHAANKRQHADISEK